MKSNKISKMCLILSVVGVLMSAAPKTAYAGDIYINNGTTYTPQATPTSSIHPPTSVPTRNGDGKRALLLTFNATQMKAYKASMLSLYSNRSAYSNTDQLDTIEGFIIEMARCNVAIQFSSVENPSYYTPGNMDSWWSSNSYLNN